MGNILHQGMAQLQCWSIDKHPTISGLIAQQACPGCGVEHGHLRHAPDCWVRIGIAWLETQRARQASPTTEPTPTAAALASVLADGPSIVARAKTLMTGGPALDPEEALTLAAYAIAMERKSR